MLFLALVLLILSVMMVVGMIKPSALSFGGKWSPTRLKVFLLWIASSFVIIMIIGVKAPSRHDRFMNIEVSPDVFKTDMYGRESAARVVILSKKCDTLKSIDSSGKDSFVGECNNGEKFNVGRADIGRQEGIKSVNELSSIALKEKMDKQSGKKSLEDRKLERMSRGFVTELLKDGDSAKFRNQNDVCGEVNSKNGFGAYTGYTRYIAPSQNMVVLESSMNQNDFNRLWMEVCK